MRILGFETSCDETGVAIYDGQRGLLSHAIHSQIAIHAAFGGVVPELASRDHIKRLSPLLDQVLNQAHIPLTSIDGIAYTAGPGLVGALLVGACFGRALGYALNVPTIAVHHMEGHLLAALLESPAPDFPFLALLVSGGHSLLVSVQGIGQYQLLGESIDDAAGEAFDKTAKLLGLGYPGGPLLAELAKSGDPNRFHFPRPLTDKPGLNFSFSGLKTFAVNTLKKSQQTLQDKADIAVAFQEAVVDTLFIKCKRALSLTGHKRLVIAGGVGANQRLREKLMQLKNTHNCDVYYPRLEFCTDNGAMIAFAGYQRLKNGNLNSDKNSNSNSNNLETCNTLEIKAYPRWRMDTL